MDNIIKTKSLDLAAYIVYRTKKDFIQIKEGENKKNYFAIEKNNKTCEAYKDYRNSQIKNNHLPITDLHLFNHAIKFCKDLTRTLH